MGEGSDHLQLIKFWPSCAPGKGVCGGAKIFGSALVQPARSVYVSLSTFSFTYLLVHMQYFHGYRTNITHLIKIAQNIWINSQWVFKYRPEGHHDSSVTHQNTHQHTVTTTRANNAVPTTNLVALVQTVYAYRAEPIKLWSAGATTPSDGGHGWPQQIHLSPTCYVVDGRSALMGV